MPYEWVPANFATGTHKQPGFTLLNPSQRAPVLEDGDFRLWESNVIVQYLCELRPESGYLPHDLKARMQAVKWQFWESAHRDPACAVFMYEPVVKKLFGLGDPNPAEVERGSQLIGWLAPVLEAQLQNTPWLAGERMTVADISVGGLLSSAEIVWGPCVRYRSGSGRWRCQPAEAAPPKATRSTGDAGQELAGRVERPVRPIGVNGSQGAGSIRMDDELWMSGGAATAVRGPAVALDLESHARRLLESERVAEAVTLALSHGAEALAAELLAKGSITLVRIAGDHAAFFAAIDKLDPEHVRRWPQLDAAGIWALAMSNRLRLASVRLDELQARIPQLLAEGRSFVDDVRSVPFDRIDPRTAMPCWVGMMRSMIAGFAGEAETALRLANQWQQSFPTAPDYEVACVACAASLGYQQTGRWVDAEREARRALAIFGEERIGYGIAWSASGLAYSLVRQGRVAEAHALVDEIGTRISALVERGTHAALPLRLVGGFLAFERGDFAALASRPAEPPADSPGPMLLLAMLRISAWMRLVAGQTAAAPETFEGAHCEASAGGRQWWERELAMERARVAAIAGQLDRRHFAGPAEQRDDRELFANCRRQPSPDLLRGLRTRLRRAEDRHDALEFAALLFAKARVEQDIGQSLQARRSIEQLLTSPLTRELTGTLMALAGGLQPAFNTVLRPLLAEAAGAHLGRLADLLLGPQALKTSAQGVQVPKLSRRERQVAALLAEGLSNRDIGDRLHLTEQTVKWHVWKLFQKLGVRNRVGAVRRLGRLGLD